MLWVCIIPSSSEGLPYMPLMDHHSSLITRKLQQLCMFNNTQKTLAHQLLVKLQDLLLTSQLVVNGLLDE